MRKLVKLLALASLAAAIATAASAADMPTKAPIAPVAVSAGPGWYFGVYGAGAKTDAKVDFVTLPSQSGNINPAGGIAGVKFGVGNWLGNLYLGVEGTAGYDFAKQAIPCIVVADCSIKHAFTGSARGIVGFTIGGLTGAAASRGITSPSQWPIPLTVPSSTFASSIMVYAGFGATGTETEACLNGIPALQGCSKRFVIGAEPGGGFRIPIASNVSLDLSGWYARLNKSFVPASTAVIFPTKFRQFDSIRGEGALLLTF